MTNRDTIFLLAGDDRLTEMPQTPYAREDLLQALIERYPELLVGEQFDGQDPPRWLVIRREMGVPDADGASDRWSLDHLLVDQNAVPTLVEVKRASDTRIRREVVGQMLDYAANAQRYWPMERVRQAAEETAGGPDLLSERLASLLELDPDEDRASRIDRFWLDMADHLRHGRVRLVFVADHLPPELRRIIEFLNEQMPAVHVVGLEIVQYARDAMRVLVPRVVGQTEAAREVKQSQAGAAGVTTRTDVDTFLASCPDDVRPFFSSLLAQADERDLEIYWGTKGFSVRKTQALHGRRGTILFGYPPGANGSSRCVLDLYIHPSTFPDEVDRQAAWQAYIKAAPHGRRGGEFTFHLYLEGEGLIEAPALVAAAWAMEERTRIVGQ